MGKLQIIVATITDTLIKSHHMQPNHKKQVLLSLTKREISTNEWGKGRICTAMHQIKYNNTSSTRHDKH